jgi:enamine deaminase RidA (YjgF/YER057c/UK114 family)
MNEVWTRWVDPHNLPARACVEARMASPGCLVELMAVAIKKRTGKD